MSKISDQFAFIARKWLPGPQFYTSVCKDAEIAPILDTVSECRYRVIECLTLDDEPSVIAEHFISLLSDVEYYELEKVFGGLNLGKIGRCILQYEVERVDQGEWDHHFTS